MEITWDTEQMANILWAILSNATKIACILIQISLQCVSDGPIANAATLVQVIVWWRTGEKLQILQLMSLAHMKSIRLWYELDAAT